MLRSWVPRLEAVYGDRVDFLDVGGHYAWTLADWSGLLEDTGMLEDESFAREDAARCFALAKFTVVDYVEHARRSLAPPLPMPFPPAPSPFPVRPPSSSCAILRLPLDSFLCSPPPQSLLVFFCW